MNSTGSSRKRWCSCRAALFVSVLALLPLLPADADPPTTTDPLPLRRVLVPPSRIAAQLEKARQRVLEKMPRAEFEALVQRAARAGERAAKPPRLTRTVYKAHLDGNALVGSTDWTVLNPIDGPAVLPLPDLNLALTRATFDDAAEAILGDLDGKTLALLVKRSGRQSLFLDWSLRGGLTGGELHFELQIPPCPVASLELELPANCTAATSRSGVLLTGPHDAGKEGWRLWRLQFGGRSRVEIVVQRPNDPGRMPPLLRAQLQTTQQLTPQNQFARYEFQVEVLHSGVRELVFDCDPALEPYEITVTKAELQGWDLDRRVQGNPPRRALTVRLREPYQSGLQPLRVSIQCLAPLLHDPKARVWQSPAVHLRGTFSQRETLKVQIYPDIQLDNWRAGTFRLRRTGPTPEGGRLLTLADSGRPGPRPQATVRTYAVDFLARQQAWWQVGPSGSSLTAELSCTVMRGALLKLPLRVSGNWQVRALHLEPRELLRNWILTKGKGSTFILVELTRAVAAREEIKLTLDLRSGQGKKVPPKGLALNFPDVEPVGAALREGTLAIRIDPSYQAQVQQASVAPAILQAKGPWPRLAPSFAYDFRGKPVTGKLRLLPQRPRVAARIRTEVQLNPGHAALTAHLELEPVVGSPEAIDLQLSASLGGPWKWSTGESGLVRGLQRQPVLEAAPRLLALGMRNPLAAAVSLGAAPPGQRWRLLLARPLTRRETVILEAPLPPHEKAAADPRSRNHSWDIPLVTVAQADSLEGELTLAPNRTEVVETRAHALREVGREGHASRPEGWRLFHYGPGLFPGQLPTLLLRTRAADLDRPSPEAIAGREACDHSQLTTYVEPQGRLLHHFRFRMWNWRRLEGGRRDLPVRLPPGVRLLAARVEGLWLDRVEQQETGMGLRVELPVPAGPQLHHFELIYASTNKDSWWTPWVHLAATPPQLPVPPASFRHTWRLPPGVVPLSRHVRRLPDPLGPNDGEPWWAPARKAWDAGRSWLVVIGPEFATDAWVAVQRQQLAEAEQALRKQHAEVKTWRLGETLEWLTAGVQRPRVAVVVDAVALRAAALTPATPLPPGKAPRNDAQPLLFAPLALTYLPCRTAPLLTTRHQQDLWQTVAGKMRSVSGAIEQAVAEAVAHGRDSSGRFQTVAYWLGKQGQASNETEGAALASSMANLMSDSFGASWTEWEVLPGATAESELLVVRRAGLRTLGLTLAVLFCLVAWRGRRALSQRWGLRLLMLWLVAAFVALFWLPRSLGDAAWWPALAGILVAVLWYVRTAWRVQFPRPHSRNGTTEKALKGISAASALLLLFSAGLLAQNVPAGQDPYLVLILPGPDDAAERQSVLITPELRKKLDELAQRGQPPARKAVLLSAEYNGRVVGERAEFTAEFQVYCPARVDTLTLPLGGVDLQEGSLWAGARVFPVTVPAPQVGYSVPLGPRNAAEINTLHVAFSMRLPPGADARELRFAVPRVPRSKLTLVLPPGTQSAQVVSGVGQQRASFKKMPRIEADLGRDGNVLVRWRSQVRVARPPKLEVRETYLWDLRPPGGALTAVLQYTVTSGTAEHFTLALPEGLGIRTVDVAQVKAQPEGLAAARLKSWRIQGKDSARRLRIQLQAPAGGEVQVTLGVLPRLPDSPGLLKLLLPTPLDGAKPLKGMLAYAVEGLRPSARAPELTVAPVAPEAFAQAWQRLGLREPIQPREAYSFRRRQGQKSAVLELTLMPQPVQAKQEVDWRVRPQHADFRLALTLKAPREELLLLEWDVLGKVSVAEVIGPEVDSWSTLGGLQVWLRKPVKDKGEDKEITVRLEVRGWTQYARPQPGRPGTFHLPCLRLRSIQPAFNRIRILASPELTILPGPAPSFKGLERLPGSEPSEGLRYRALTPFYRGNLVFRPSPVSATARTLGLVEARDGALAYTGLVDFQIPHGELRSATVRVGNWKGDDVHLEAPRAVQVRTQHGPKGERTWLITLPPGVTRGYAVRVTGTLPLRASEMLAMPQLSAPRTAAGPDWVAVLGQGVRAEASRGLQPVKDAVRELQAWPAEAERVRREGAAWRVLKDRAALHLVGRPAGASLVQVLHAEQEAAVTDLKRWVHQATYCLHASGSTDLQLILPRGARLLAAAMDGTPLAPRQQKDRALHLALAGGEKLHVLRLRWTFEAGTETLARPRLEAPRFKDVSEPSRIWRVDVPTGYRIDVPRSAPDEARSVGSAAVEVARAEGQLQFIALLVERLRTGAADTVVAQLATAQQQFSAHCRQADNLLAAGGQGPSGKGLAERLREVRQRQARLTRGLGTAKPRRAKTGIPPETEAARSFFRLPERGLASYWSGSGPGQAPRVILVGLTVDRWHASVSATELLLIVVAGIWVLAYLPRVQRWVCRLLPEQVVLLGWLGTQAFGPSPVGVLLIACGLGARVVLAGLWLQNRLRSRGPDETPTASSFHSA